MKKSKNETKDPEFPTWLGVVLLVVVFLVIGLSGYIVPDENKRIAAYKRLGGRY